MLVYQLGTKAPKDIGHFQCWPRLTDHVSSPFMMASKGLGAARRLLEET